MYSDEEKIRALQTYDEIGSVQETIRKLGYPKRQTLYIWLHERDLPAKIKSKNRGKNTPEHPRHPAAELKLGILHRCFELGEDVKSVANEVGYSRASIYAWRRKYLKKGTISLMNPNDVPRGKLTPDVSSSFEEINELRSKIQDMQMEIDILKETIKVLKKDPGVSMAILKNSEKAVIVDALKDRYPLPLLLDRLALSKSSYYYQKSSIKKIDKYAETRCRIIAIFNENKNCYGYRRIHAVMQKGNCIVSEKIVRRIMREENLVAAVKQRRKYNSYKGEISPSVPNIIQRNFHANRPNKKWLTDITEFAIPAGKLYLSAIIDCFDGMLVSWTFSTTPSASLVNNMLEKAIAKLSENEHPLVHTDRGCHYRWPGWIERMNKAGLERSMSRKGCSPDNAACEGFFGRLKNEMFYNHNWSGVSISKFITILNDYLIWYNQKRIKVSLGNMSPIEYRHSLRLIA